MIVQIHQLRQAINTIVVETEEEEHDANTVTADTFIQLPITTNAPRENRRCKWEGNFFAQSGINDKRI